MKPIDDSWTSERLGRPAVWIAGRALVLTLIVLLAVSFDRGSALVGEPQALGLSWPAPLGYLTALLLIYASSGLYFIARSRFRVDLGVWILLLDLPVASAIVHWTGGIDSHFVMVFLPIALAAGVMRGPGLGLALAAASVACYAMVLVAESSGLIAPRGFGADAGRAFTGQNLDVVRVSLQVLVLALTGWLSGHLGKALAERSRALQAASRKLARARLDTEFIIEHLGSGLVSVDDDGRILHFNRAAGRIMGVQPAEIIGRPAAEALPPGAAPFIAWLEEARRGRESLFRREVEITTADGRSMPLGMTGTNAAEIIDPGASDAELPGGFIAVFQDLTRARHEETERARQQHLAVIGGLAGGITHEIRNCVKPISGSLDLLMKELDLDASSRRLMELAVRECNRLGHFVQAMLDYGRVNPLMIQDVDLGELVEEVAELGRLSESAREHRIVVDIDGGAQGRTIEADREQIKQVLVNLMINSLEAMTEPGTVTLGLGLGVGSPQDGQDARFVITVRDTGPGIDPNTRKRVFEPFFTTKQGGTGFGLAIASSIVERHGGAMELDDEAGSGACFRLTLPERSVIENPLVA